MCELLVEKEFNENYFNYAFLLQFGGKLGISFVCFWDAFRPFFREGCGGDGDVISLVSFSSILVG